MYEDALAIGSLQCALYRGGETKVLMRRRDQRLCRTAHLWTPSLAESCGGSFQDPELDVDRTGHRLTHCSGVVCRWEKGCGPRRAVRNTRSSSAQDRWRADEGAQEALRGSIQAVLVELFDRHHEVPFIASHRKAVRACAPQGSIPLVVGTPERPQSSALHKIPFIASHRRRCVRAPWVHPRQ